jgi:hypothetical protein
MHSKPSLLAANPNIINYRVCVSDQQKVNTLKKIKQDNLTQ